MMMEKIILSKTDKVDLLTAIQNGEISLSLLERIAGKPNQNKESDEMKLSEILAEIWRLEKLDNISLKQATGEIMDSEQEHRFWERYSQLREQEINEAIESENMPLE